MKDLNSLPKSASMEVSKLAKEMAAYGKEIVNMSVGDTHFPLSAFLQGKIIKACENGYTHYDKASGLDQLRDRIAQSYHVNSAQVIIGNGVKNILYNYLLTKPGKSVCILEPAWLGYKGICHLTDTEAITINIYENNWLDQLKKLKFEYLILCAPNNPDGKLYSEKEVNTIKSICTEKGVTLILDEIYKDYIYEGQHHFKNLYSNSNTIILNGFSKSHAATGLRIGYGIFKDDQDLDLINRIQQNTFTCSNTISQYALSFFQENMEYVESYKNYYQNNRDHISEIIPELTKHKPASGFYYFFPLNDIGINLSAQEFCKDILNQKGLALIPGESYGSGFENYVRLSFCIDNHELQKGICKFREYIDEHE